MSIMSILRSDYRTKEEINMHASSHRFKQNPVYHHEPSKEALKHREYAHPSRPGLLEMYHVHTPVNSGFTFICSEKDIS